jgi:hypothetical protein
MGKEELGTAAKELQAPRELVEYVAAHGKLPVPNFSAGGIATPADAALVMQLGAETVFVGSASSSLPTPTRAPAPSSRRRPTTTIPRSCSKPAASWARPCRAWKPRSCRKPS